MKNLAYLFFLTFPLLIWAKPKTDLSGNLEAQGRHSWNGDSAKKDFAQDWDEEEFYLFYGNLNAKTEFKNSRLEANFFGRHSHSDLFKERNPSFLPPFLAPQIFTFPRKLVARDIFKLKHEKQGDDYRTEYLLNKFYYEWDYQSHRFMAGRIYINYGLGEVFNPINPFNQPTGLTSISQVAQGNDGVNFTFYADEKHTIDFYLLGDKSIHHYDGEIEETFWAHGEYQASNDLQLDYVLGQDQNRYKLGGQIRYHFSDAMLFMQTLYQSDFINNDGSHPLWDAMLGVDQQLTNKWHLRFEGGYQKKDRFSVPGQLGDRFLPSEYFLALANQFEVHPLVKVNGTIINDLKSGFTYFIARNAFDLGRNSEAEIFAYLPVSRGKSGSPPEQKLVTTDVGVALRTFF